MVLILTLTIVVLSIVIVLSIYYDSRAYRAHLRAHRQSQTQALIYHPVVRAKEQDDRAHELATRKLELETFLAHHRIKAGYYSINEQIHTVSAFPSFSPSQESSKQEDDKVVEGSLVYDRPSLEAMLPTLPYNGLQIAYGRNLTTGELLTSTLIDAVHILILGDIGMGKSTQAGGILTALSVRNDPQHLQLALLDHEGITSEPFIGLPHTRYLAESPEEAARNLGYLVRELERRQARRLLVTPGIDPRMLTFPLLLLFIEEFVTLKNALKGKLRDQALADFTRLSLQGRKFGMFMLCIGQTGYMDKDIRDAQRQFQSKMALGIHPKAAAAAGFTNTELLNQNNAPRVKGRFVLEGTKGPALVMAPHITYDDIPRLLGATPSSPPSYPPSSPQGQSGYSDGDNINWLGKPMDIENGIMLSPAQRMLLLQVIELDAQQKGQNEIISAIWQCDPNTRQGRVAVEELRVIRAYIAQETRKRLGV